VEAHLAECEICRAELESLEEVSGLLHQVPVPQFTSPERFAAQVNLRLPHQKAAPTPSGKKILEIGWWMAPVGLLAAWVFISTSFVVNDMLSVANNVGLLSNVSNWMMFGGSSIADWSATLGQYGILSGNSLNWAETTETFTRTSLPLISLQVSIALLYLSWIAIWWVRRTRRGPGQLLEG
jgi:hypothetical protein